MPRRIDAGEILAALGGLLVVVSLFLSWFGDSSGWTSFETLDLVLCLLGLAAIAIAVNAALDRMDGPPAWTLPVIGGLLVFIVAVQLIDPPPGAPFEGAYFNEAIGSPAEGATFGLSREVGAWLALLGSALVLAGGILRMSKISVTLNVGGRDARRRVPAVDRRAAAASASPMQRPGGPVGTGPEGGASGIGAAIEEAEQHSEPAPAPVEPAPAEPVAPADVDQRTQAFNALDADPDQRTQAFNALEAEEARDQS